MKIKIVILDNDKEFGEDLAGIISSYDEKFYESLDTEITGIIAIPTTNPQDAFNEIKKGDVSLLSLDIELDDTRGDAAYESLFFDGTAVPCIVVSAVVDTEESEQQVRRKGVSEIIHIARGQTDVAERLVRTICSVLKDRQSKFKQIQTYVDMLNVQNNMMNHNSEDRRVQDWINSVVQGEYSPLNENEIIQKIVRECIHQSQLNQDHNHGFMHS